MVKQSNRNFFRLLIICFLFGLTSFANASDNQTDDLSPVQPVTGLPFRVVIEAANFQLPVGFHSGAVGVYNQFWVFIAGRTNGLHGFSTNNFPPDSQNTIIYVVNSKNGAVYSRALNDPNSGLSQRQIDLLSVTSPQFYQDGNILYMTGGYGVDTGTGTFETKPYLTAIDLPTIISWVMHPEKKFLSAAKSISQIYNPLFQITGGSMAKIGSVTNLVFGQSFTGPYTDNTNGAYSQQVRRFRITNNGGKLSLSLLPSAPLSPDASFRRRDLNIVPIVSNNNGRLHSGLVAYAGVFTPQSGVWTVPVVINQQGVPMMANPNLPTTFKQAMNHYVCPTVGLYSKKNLNMYTVLFGGISYGFFNNGSFQTDNEIPFINQVTTIKIDRNSNFSQYLMDGQYPTILSTQSNPGNPLLFGAGAFFLVNKKISHYDNGVLNLDAIHKPIMLGYIVGGIQSTLPDTNVNSDSAASPYIFKVTLVPV